MGEETMRPSARKDETKSPSTRHVQLDDAREARLGDDHVVQHVARRVGLPLRGAPPRGAGGAPRTRSARRARPRGSGYSSGRAISVRKPRLPKFTPSTGHRRARAGGSPPGACRRRPSTTRASALAATSRPEATRQRGGRVRPAESGRALVEAGAHARARGATRRDRARAAPGLAPGRGGPGRRSWSCAHRLRGSARREPSAGERRALAAEVQEELAVALGAR